MTKLSQNTTEARIWRSPDQVLEELSSVAVFGTGQCGVALTQLLEQRGISVCYYLDNAADKQGTEFFNKPVHSPEVAYRDQPVVLVASFWAREIAGQLSKHGIEYYDFSFSTDYNRWKNHFSPDHFNAKKALDVGTKFLEGADKQAFFGCVRYRQTMDPLSLQPSEFDHYFHPSVSPTGGDWFVDGGAWQGDTVEYLKNKFGSRIGIHCFEPDTLNRKVLSQMVHDRQYEDVVISSLGLWSHSETLRFLKSEDVGHSMQARVDNRAGESLVFEVEAKDLDSYCIETDLKPDFIKLDVEGAESQVMMGSERVLQECQPRLAISAYHEPEDLWSLMVRIYETNPRYRFYFGHHSQNLFESVVYARVEDGS
ncbi:FkbM family methyltransferase [Marinobacter metalliresistant]|uniref:FkbM family methyltransferase n=1 Tax=Marinobacter metalliresistant TaxID=2961995 RepID=A0ABZ2W4X0_9GAMM